MRKVLAAVGIAGVMVLSASPAFADRGAPGTTFPEQPSGSLSQGCSGVLGHPNGSSNHSTIANSITTGLVIDACFGG